MADNARKPLKFTAEFDGSKMEEGFKKTLTKISKTSDKFSTDLRDKLTKAMDLPNPTLKAGTIAKNVSLKFNVSPEISDTIIKANAAFAVLSDNSQELASRLSQLKIESQKLNAAKKALGIQFQNGGITADQYKISLGGVESEQQRLATALRGLSVQVAQSSKLEQAAAGSLEEARLKYNQLTLAITKAGGAMNGFNPHVNKMITSHQTLRKEIDAMESKLGQYQRNVGNYASGWNGLQNSINQVTRELPAFTYSAQTGFMAISNNLPILVDELKKASDANKALTAEGKKGVPVWKQLASSLFGWQTLMMVGITLSTVYGKEIGNWIKSLFGAKKAIDATKVSQDTLNKALESTDFGNAVQNIERLRSALDMVKKGMVDKKSVVEEYNKTIGQTVGEVKNLDEVERFLIANAENYVKMTLYKASANLALEEASKAAYEAEKTRLKELEEFSNNAMDMTFQARSEEQWRLQQQQILKNQKDRKQAEIKIHEDAEQTQLDISRKFMERAQNEASKLGVSIFGNSIVKIPQPSNKEARELERMIADREDVLQKISDIDQEYARKSMESDEAEIQALQDKFDRIRRIIVEENDQIRRHNIKNLKNRVPLINESIVDPIQERATHDLQYKQATKHLIDELEAQKKLIQEYEEYRDQFGTTAAEKYYDKQLNIIKGYAQRIEQEFAETISFDPTASLEFNGSNGKKLTQAQEERYKFLQEERERQRELERQHLNKLMSEYATYEQQRTALIEKSEKNIVDLQKKGTKESLAAAEQVKKQLTKALTEMDLEYFKDSTGFDRLMEFVQDSGVKASREALKQGKAIIENLIKGTKDPSKIKALKDLLKPIEQSLKSLNDGKFDGVANLLENFDQLVSMATQFDGTMGTALKTVGSMVKQVGTMAKTIGEMLGSAGSGLAKSGSGIAAIIGAVLSVVGGIIQIFDQANQKREQQAKENAEYSYQYQLKQLDAVTSILEYQLSLIKDIYGAERVRAYVDLMSDASDAFNKNMASWGRPATRSGSSAVKDVYLLTGNKDLDDKITEYNNLTSAGGDRRHIEETIKKKNRLAEEIKSFGVDVKNLELAFTSVEDITADQILELNRLLQSGQLDEVSAKVVQNLLDQVDIYREALEQMREEINGMSFGSFTDDISQMFAQGKHSVDDFTEYLEKKMQNAVIKSFARDEIEKRMRPWYDEMAELGKDGFTEEEINYLRGGFQALGVELNGLFDNLEKITGVDFDTTTNSSNNLSRSITRMIESDSYNLKATNISKFKIAI